MTYAERVARTPVVDSNKGDNQDVAKRLRDYVRELDIRDALETRS
jgi:hypothetical protein